MRRRNVLMKSDSQSQTKYKGNDNNKLEVFSPVASAQIPRMPSLVSRLARLPKKNPV